MRAIVPGSTAQTAELRFRYLGPSAETALLGSGLLRRQLGLKLRAQDGCNVVYVMWRLAPESRLAVSIKTNRGERRSSACENRGYRILKPQPRLPDPLPGSWHRLRAALDGTQLRVEVDGAAVGDWKLDPVVRSFEGPPGVRSDNARFEFSLRVGPEGGGSRTP